MGTTPRTTMDRLAVVVLACLAAFALSAPLTAHDHVEAAAANQTCYISVTDASKLGGRVRLSYCIQLCASRHFEPPQKKVLYPTDPAHYMPGTCAGVPDPTCEMPFQTCHFNKPVTYKRAYELHCPKNNIQPKDCMTHASGGPPVNTTMDLYIQDN